MIRAGHVEHPAPGDVCSRVHEDMIEGDQREPVPSPGRQQARTTQARRVGITATQQRAERAVIDGAATIKVAHSSQPNRRIARSLARADGDAQSAERFD